MDDCINVSKNWIFLVSRPFTLFGVSLYQAWFDPPHLTKLVGTSLVDNLFVEEHAGVIRRYVIKEQLDAFTNAVKDIVRNDTAKCSTILNEAMRLNEEAKRQIEKPSFTDLGQAMQFLVKLATHATVFSYFSYPLLVEAKNAELTKIAESLRAMSYYPQVIEHVIKPLAKQTAGDDYELMTLAEVLGGDHSQVAMRKEAAHSGKKFCYAKVDGKECVQYVDDAWAIILKLEHMTLGEEVRGQVAYPGTATGRVRLVLTADPKVPFNPGDILVSVSTHPALIPLMRKCGAIVCDEGGIMSHAAIVSRELKKPCIIATKFGTHVLKDGDTIEVDANKGIVRKVNPS